MGQRMAHACSTLLIHCMDFRFVRGIRAWMDEQGTLGDCDVIAIPGAAKVLADPQMPEDADFLMRAIGVGANLHRVQCIILMNHLDCGAYGGAAAFLAPEAERERHARDLGAAGEAIRERFPHLKVEFVLASLARDGAVTVEHLGTLDPPIQNIVS